VKVTELVRCAAVIVGNPRLPLVSASAEPLTGADASSPWKRNVATTTEIPRTSAETNSCSFGTAFGGRDGIVAQAVVPRTGRSPRNSECCACSDSHCHRAANARGCAADDSDRANLDNSLNDWVAHHGVNKVSEARPSSGQVAFVDGVLAGVVVGVGGAAVDGTVAVKRPRAGS
jgi:hypothetical protein